MTRFLAMIFAVLIVAGCGFRPLYGTATAGPEAASVRTHLADVDIDNIPDRSGQMLRNMLIDRFYTKGPPAGARYVLEITPLRERLTDLDITRSSDATRGQLRLEAEMVLRAEPSKAVLLRHDLRAITSYNILHSRFTTRVSEDSARNSAIADLARQIENQMALYFTRTP